MNDDSKKDLDEILNSNDSSRDRKIVDNSKETTDKSKKIEEVLARIGKYLSNKERLKAIGVLAGTIAGVVLLKDKLPEITDYIRDVFPILSKEAVSLTVDTLTNAILAPLGFYYSCKANNKEYTKKELRGQIAFAAVWGVIRHYVYSGLYNFDEPVNLKNISLKTGLYTAYYAAYGGLYTALSEYWHKVCDGIPSSEAIKGTGKNFKKKLGAIVKDPEVAVNWALHVFNMFQPWVESRPTFGAALIIQYNMSVLKKSLKVRDGFARYIFGNRDITEKHKKRYYKGRQNLIPNPSYLSLSVKDL